MGEPNSKGGSHLSKRKKKYVVGNMVERISALPDEILVNIVSLLPLKEAQATSVLAQRWQYVWAYRTNLNFDDGKNLLRLGMLERRAHEQEQSKYVNWVDSALKQHRDSKIERFKVCFELKPRSCFDEWIQSAMRKGVQKLELDFYQYQHVGYYTFSNKMLAISETLALNSSFVEYYGFKCLKDLHLKSVNVDQEVLEFFMLNYSVLERLAMDGSTTLVNLRVVGQSIALKHLMILYCYEIGIIEICDANLVSFRYDKYVTNLVISNVPHPVKVSIWGEWYWSLSGFSNDFIKRTFCHLSDCVSHLEVLKLDYSNVSCKEDHVIPSLSNLKRLELVIHSTYGYVPVHLATFIKRSPYMHTLVLQLSQSWTKESPFRKKKAAKCSHDYLKVIKIVEFKGLSRQIELVKYLLKTASALETLVFDPVDPWSLSVSRLLDDVVKEEEFSRA